MAEKLIYWEQGGVWLGFFNWTWPFARLEVYDSKLIIKYPFRKREFPKDSIISISTVPMLFSVGLKINHKFKSGKFIVYWSVYRKTVIRNLRKAGYSIK